MDCITQTSVTSGFWSGLANGDHLESNQSTGDLKKKKKGQIIIPAAFSQFHTILL